MKNRNTARYELQARAPASTCPAAAVGLQIAEVETALKAAPLRPLVEQQLWDRLEALDRQLEWVVPTSIEGLFLVTAQIEFLRDLVADEDSVVARDELLRRMGRLTEMNLQALEAMASFSPAEVGAGLKRKGFSAQSAASAIAA
jgi:hypothetical protein